MSNQSPAIGDQPGNTQLPRALAYALTGQRFPGTPGNVADLEPFLAAEGWDRSRLAAHVQECRTAHRPWPHPLPDDLSEGLSAAQVMSVLARLRADWQLEARTAQMRTPLRRTSSPRATSPTDRRLWEDVPPHFGKL